MNTKTWKFMIVVVCILAAAGGMMAWRENGLAPQGAGHGRHIYYCPMHPGYTSGRPGDCPVCGMKLVKKETSQAYILADGTAKSASGGHAAVYLDHSQQQLIGVGLVKVVKRPFVKTIRTYGYVTNDMDLYKAQLEYIGVWRKYALFRRSRAVKDEFPDDWGEFSGRAPGEGFRKARERLLKAEYELRHRGFQDAQLEQLRLIKYELAEIQPEILLGQKWQPLWIHARILEEDLGYVDVGQKAVVDIPAYRESFEGIVRSVGDEVDPRTRTVIVRIGLPGGKEYLKVNMYADVLMPVELNDVLMVPRAAVMNTGLRQIVFVQRDPSHFEPVETKTGMESNGMVEVREGLTEGEMVVVGGNFLVDAESRLQAAFPGMTATGKLP